MPGNVVDLSVGRPRFPDIVVVDTNPIVEYVLVPSIGERTPAPVAIASEPASAFFEAVYAHNGTGIVAPTTLVEFVHTAVRDRCKQERLRLRSKGRPSGERPIGDWLALSKQDETVLRAFLPHLEQPRRLSIANGLLLVAPDCLGPIPSGRACDEEPVRHLGTYGLDSGDAVILMEARRYGVADIVALDKDLRRARADFTVFTWL